MTLKATVYAQKFQGGGTTYGHYGRLRVVVKAVVSGAGGGTFTLGTVNMPEKEVRMNSYPSSSVVSVEGNVSVTKSSSSRTVKITFTVEYRGDNYIIYSGNSYTWPIDDLTACWARFTELSYDADGAVVIGEGDLNYIAIGE